MITTKLLQFANDKLDTEEMLFIQIGETSTPFPPFFLRVKETLRIGMLVLVVLKKMGRVVGIFCGLFDLTADG